MLIIYQEDKRGEDFAMDINTVRRENLRKLVQLATSQADFAESCGTAPSVISLIVSPNPKRNLGDKLARKIEAARELPHGWLDVSHPDQGAIDVSSLPAPLAQKISSYRARLSIDRFDIAGSMGPGTEPPDLHNIVDSMTLDAAWVRQNLVYTAVENIKLISGRGDSMSPTIKNGDPLLVDVGITSVECDAIYFFLMAGQLHIKRIQRHLDGLSILSDNERYRPVEVAAAREIELTIFAQVIYGWNGQKF